MPDSNGGYSLWQELTVEQQAQWRQKLTGRMGAALQDHFRADPASYERAVKAVGVM
jgi:hypothetical protein